VALSADLPGLERFDREFVERALSDRLTDPDDDLMTRRSLISLEPRVERAPLCRREQLSIVGEKVRRRRRDRRFRGGRA
jgi:hypothetical protein